MFQQKNIEDGDCLSDLETLANTSFPTDASGGASLFHGVAAAWERALGPGTSSLDGDFFDLGGDSLKAIDLLLDIEQSVGVKSPLATLYDAPRLNQLAQAIASSATSRSSRLIRLKDGGDLPPLFMVHGVQGHVMVLYGVARRLEYPGPVYAIAARGLDGEEAPASCIDSMARDYLAAIKTIQPVGPYHLVGYSFGGLVVYQMARELTAGDEAVGLAALIDTMPSQRQWSISVWFHVIVRRLRNHAKAFLSRPPWQWPSYFLRVFRSLIRRYGRRGGNRPAESPRSAAPDLSPAIQKVQEAGLRASDNYKLTWYPGEIVLFKATHRRDVTGDPERAWRGHSRTLTVRRVPGDHQTIIRDYADRLAAEILPFLPAGKS
jgi:acetoacetyl-CoA synthetase